MTDTTQTQTDEAADGLAAFCERYIRVIDALHSTPVGTDRYNEADDAVLSAIIALDEAARPAAAAARIEQRERETPAWFEQETIGICAECVDTADIGALLRVQPLDDRDRCASCADAYRSPADDDADIEFSPIAPPQQPISPAEFYALHRAILAAQAAREQRTDRNDWPILAEAERSEAEAVMLRNATAPFDCAAPGLYAVAIPPIGPAPRVSWNGQMDSFRIEWGESEAAAPEQHESE